MTHPVCSNVARKIHVTTMMALVKSVYTSNTVSMNMDRKISINVTLLFESCVYEYVTAVLPRCRLPPNWHKVNYPHDLGLMLSPCNMWLAEMWTKHSSQRQRLLAFSPRRDGDISKFSWDSDLRRKASRDRDIQDRHWDIFLRPYNTRAQ